MRYSDRSGGLSGTERERREALRLQAADMFSGGIAPPRAAHLLGVTRKSACEWHRAWLKGDKAALVSKGAAGTGCKLTNQQLVRLEAFLDEGAIAHGWDDQRWTSARVAALIAERFHIRYTPCGVAYAAQEEWLLVYRLPAYAPELNPAEGVWSSLRTKLFNFTVCGIDELTGLIKNRLKPLQYWPDLLKGSSCRAPSSGL